VEKNPLRGSDVLGEVCLIDLLIRVVSTGPEVYSSGVCPKGGSGEGGECGELKPPKLSGH